MFRRTRPSSHAQHYVHTDFDAVVRALPASVEAAGWSITFGTERPLDPVSTGRLAVEAGWRFGRRAGRAAVGLAPAGHELTEVTVTLHQRDAFDGAHALAAALCRAVEDSDASSAPRTPDTPRSVTAVEPLDVA